MKNRFRLLRVLLSACLPLLSALAAAAAPSGPRTSNDAPCYDLWTCLQLEPGTTATLLTQSWQGASRKVLVIAPKPAPTTPAPALVLLHGRHMGTTLMANVARASRLASQLGFYVVLPAAYWDWDISPDQTAGRNDVGFLATVIARVTRLYPIDRTRISMAGFSKGAYMTEVMACQRPDLLASAAVVAGTMTGPNVRACAPSRPLPMLYILGTADPRVNYAGDYGQLSATADFSFWSGLLACGDAWTWQRSLPVTVQDGTSVSLRRNTVCSAGGEVNLYTINGGGHAWPDGNYATRPNLGTITQNLDATMVIGQFAARWTTQSTQ